MNIEHAVAEQVCALALIGRRGLGDLADQERPKQRSSADSVGPAVLIKRTEVGSPDVLLRAVQHRVVTERVIAVCACHEIGLSGEKQLVAGVASAALDERSKTR